MSFDAFIRIDGIEGESTDDKHIGWIEVKDCHLSVNQRVSSTASSVGGASAERANFSELTFTKLLDKATPKLALACADGTHIDKIVVELCRAGKEKVKFMEYELTHCLVSKFSSASPRGEFPVDDVSIHYGKLLWKYTQQGRSGGGAIGCIASGWNLEKNCKA